MAGDWCIRQNLAPEVNHDFRRQRGAGRDQVQACVLIGCEHHELKTPPSARWVRLERVIQKDIFAKNS